MDLAICESSSHQCINDVIRALIMMTQSIMTEVWRIGEDNRQLEPVQVSFLISKSNTVSW